MAEDDLLIRAAIRDELSGPLRDIQRQLGRTASAAGDAGDRANAGARGFDRMARGIGSAGRMAGGIALTGLGALGAGLGVAAAAATVLGVKTASAMQQARISFETMLGSAEKAGKFLGELKKFAATTPFEFPELQTAASSLISAGIQADKVIPIMRSLGDVTSGMGTGSEGVQRATVALQQMSAAGRITGEDLNQLRDAGVPVFDLLAAATGKSKKEVAALAQAGKLGGKELGQLMNALETGKGLERFSGLMEKQSQSLAGVWSTLKDTVAMSLADALNPAIPAMTGFVAKLGVLAGVWLPRASTELTNIVGKGRELFATFQTFGLDTTVSSLDAMTGSGGRLSEAFTVAKGIAGDVATVVRDSLVPAITTVTTAISPAWLTPLGLARAALSFLANNTELARVAIVGIVTALTAAKVATIAYSLWTTASNAASIAAAAGRGFLTGATVAQTGAERLNTAARVQNTAAKVGNGIVTTALAVKTGALAVATGVATVATKALSLAMRLTPIGMVVTGLTLLVGLFVTLYKKSDRFREVIDGLVDKLKELAGGLKKLGGGLLGKLPGFAEGGLVPGGTPGTGRGTLAMVGERGPELLALPGGSFVLPNEVLGAIRNSQTRADAERLFGSSVAPAAQPVVVGAGGDSLTVTVDRPSSTVDVELAVERVLARRERRRQERS